MIRGTLSKERFEDLWQTLLPIGSYDVSFMDFVRWASRCLPVKILADDEEFSISQPFASKKHSVEAKLRIELSPANINFSVVHERESTYDFRVHFLNVHARSTHGHLSSSAKCLYLMSISFSQDALSTVPARKER